MWSSTVEETERSSRLRAPKGETLLGLRLIAGLDCGGDASIWSQTPQSSPVISGELQCHDWKMKTIPGSLGAVKPRV